MKKVMWLGLFVEITTLIIIVSLLLLQKPVSGILVSIFVAAMLICIVSSLFVQRENTKENYSKQNEVSGRKNILKYITVLIPLIGMLIITYFFV